MLSSFRSIPFSLSRVAGSASVSTSRLAHVRNGTASRSLATLSSSSPSASDTSDSTTRMAMAAASGVVMAALGVSLLASDQTQLPSLLPNRTQMEASSALEDDNDTTTTILNWSGTHNVLVDNHNYWEPETIEEVERIVRWCHERGQPVRPVGSALSPNGLAFRSGGMMSMANLDRIISVDKPSGSNSSSSGDEMPTVTVQAGARVSQVVDALREHGLTLPNLASIAEQQMGGFVQVGAHGTGKAIAPVDHYVTQLKLVTPARGTLTLRADAQDEDERELFHLAKVGLGCLGVVVEVTMQCIPAHMLVEHTFVLTRQEAKDQLDTLLKKHKHMRYMWIPFEDAVVCVTNDPEDQVTKKVNATNSMDEAERFQPLTDLLLELSKERQQHEEDFPPSLVTSSSVVTKYTTESIVGMGFGELRDALLAFDPLNVDHVKRVNKAEAEFWRKSEGYQTKPSDQLLQFDCGGQVRYNNSGILHAIDIHLCFLLTFCCCCCCSNGFGKYVFQLAHKIATTAAILHLWKNFWRLLRMKIFPHQLPLNKDGRLPPARSCHRHMGIPKDCIRGLELSIIYRRRMNISGEILHSRLRASIVTS